MSEKPSNQSLAASRKFIPELKPLESRLLLSQSQRVSFPDGTSFVFPTFAHLPRTGGVSVQNGTVLGIGVGQRREQRGAGYRSRQRRFPGRMERRSRQTVHRPSSRS